MLNKKALQYEKLASVYAETEPVFWRALSGAKYDVAQRLGGTWVWREFTLQELQKVNLDFANKVQDIVTLDSPHSVSKILEFYWKHCENPGIIMYPCNANVLSDEIYYLRKIKDVVHFNQNAQTFKLNYNGYVLRKNKEKGCLCKEQITEYSKIVDVAESDLERVYPGFTTRFLHAHSIGLSQEETTLHACRKIDNIALTLSLPGDVTNIY